MRRWLGPAWRAPNACRYDPQGGGHVESYFWRANDPRRPRALWLKATLLAPRSGPPVAEAWGVWFDGETGRTLAHRETRPLSQGMFPAADSGRIDVAGCTFSLSPTGSAAGELKGSRGSLSWRLGWTREPTAVGEPLSLYPNRLLLEGPFPRSKLLTPLPALRFSGSVEAFGETVDVASWVGMQGHNWGREHPWEYAWGQCLFPGASGELEAMVEGFTGRLRLAGRTTPAMSALVIRRGARTYRFDRIFDLWRQRAELSERRWLLSLRGADGAAELTMDAGSQPIACLGYRNPDGRLSYCLNTKLARVRLWMKPAGEGPFEYESAHGGALEFLRNTPDPRLADVV